MLEDAVRDVRRLDVRTCSGRITALDGLRIDATGPNHVLRLGGIAHLGDADGPRAEIVGFKNHRAVMLAADPIDHITPGDHVHYPGNLDETRPSPQWLGRVLDAFGDPLDHEAPPLRGPQAYALRATPPPASARERVTHPLRLGVRALDIFSPCARGQRLGLFAGSGVGKSSLLSMLARHSDADVVVMGLIGERGRELREFIEDTLGKDGLQSAVVIASTADEPAPKRRRAALLTMSVAEYFRDQGQHVLCLLDSVTRFALAQREIGLAAGEPPTTRGYTPSVFAELPRLLERAGPGICETPSAQPGSITGLFTVLVEGDDHNEPIADAVRSFLDGHVIMSRHIAERGRYPAIDVLKSLSRLESMVHGPERMAQVRAARAILSIHADMEEMIRIGAYVKGSDAETDRAIALAPPLYQFLSQSVGEHVEADEFTRLEALLSAAQPPAIAQS